MLSGVYRKAFAEHDLKVEQRIAQSLSGLIESGDISSDKLLAEANRILGPIRNCSHILLACTHYPAILPLFKDFVSSKTRFIDPAGGLLNKISRWRFEKAGNDVFLTSGNMAAMKKAAKAAFAINLSDDP